jgi:hypothetical protein
MAKNSTTSGNTGTTATTKAPKGGKGGKNTKPQGKGGKGAKAKANATPSTNGHSTRRLAGLTGRDIRVLEQLAKFKDGLTRNDLKAKCGIAKGFSKIMGTPSKDVYADNTLEGRGLVAHDTAEGVRGFTYTITAKGKAALAEAKGEAKKAK